MAETVAVNRKARHDYLITDTFEAGLVLTGTEIKSVRAGKVNLSGAYARVDRGEAWPLMLTSRRMRRATATTTSPSGRASCCCIGSRSISWSAGPQPRA